MENEEKEVKKMEKGEGKTVGGKVMWGCQCLHEANQECSKGRPSTWRGLAAAEEEEEEVSANTGTRQR